jgi:hypothetical protein
MDYLGEHVRCAVCGTKVQIPDRARVTAALTATADNREIVMTAAGVEVHRCMSPATRRLTSKFTT